MGIKFYALVAIVLAFAGLAGYAALEHQSKLTAQARIETVTHERDDLASKLVQAETDKAELTKQRQALDAAVVERDKRAKELENAKRKISVELDALKRTLPQADQSCLDRDLPPAILGRLLDDGPDHGNATPEDSGSRQPPPQVPQDRPRG